MGVCVCGSGGEGGEECKLLTDNKKVLPEIYKAIVERHTEKGKPPQPNHYAIALNSNPGAKLESCINNRVC